jgi:hypothetical protein
MNAHVKQSAFVIENRVPLPPRSVGGRPEDPNSLSGVLRRMKVGQSLFISGTRRSPLGGTRGARMKPKKFTTRTVEGGIRVWRTA